MIKLKSMHSFKLTNSTNICWQGDVVIDGWENINIFLGRAVSNRMLENEYISSEANGLDVLPPLRGVPFSNRGEPFAPGVTYFNLITENVNILDEGLDWRLFCSNNVDEL